MEGVRRVVHDELRVQPRNYENRIQHAREVQDPEDATPMAPRKNPDMTDKQIQAVTNPDAHKSARGNIKLLLTSGPLGLDAVLRDLELVVLNADDKAALSTRNQRIRVQAQWAELIETVYPELKDNIQGQWVTHVVKKHAFQFLPLFVAATPGRQGRKHIKASTLLKFFSLFIWNIIRWTADVDGTRTGMYLLMRQDMYTTLDNGVSALIIKYDLDRYTQPKQYNSRFELKLVLEEAFRNTSMHGRAVALQSGSQLLSSFYVVHRPSSVGWSDQALKAQGKYPRVKHARFFRMAIMAYCTDLTLTHFKRHNDRNSHTQKHRLEPVENWFNLLFEYSLWLIGDFMARGLFVGIKTVQDLYDSTDYELLTDPDRQEEPLFLRVGSGGRQFHPSGEAASAKAIYNMSVRLHQNAGMPGAGTYCYRRESANIISILLGNQGTQELLAHEQLGSLPNYTKGPTNYNMVGLMLSEGGHTRTVVQRAAVDKFRLEAPAVGALYTLTKNSRNETSVRSTAVTTSSTVGASSSTAALPIGKKITSAITTLTDAQRDEISRNPELVASNILEREAWSVYRSCRSVPLKFYSDARNQMCYFEEATTLVVPEEEFIAAREALIKINVATNKIRQRVTRQARRVIQQEFNAKVKDTFEGTTEEREDLAKGLEAPSEILRVVLADAAAYKAKIAASTPQSISHSIPDVPLQGRTTSCPSRSTVTASPVHSERVGTSRDNDPAVEPAAQTLQGDDDIAMDGSSPSRDPVGHTDDSDLQEEYVDDDEDEDDDVDIDALFEACRLEDGPISSDSEDADFGLDEPLTEKAVRLTSILKNRIISGMDKAGRKAAKEKLKAEKARAKETKQLAKLEAAVRSAKTRLRDAKADLKAKARLRKKENSKGKRKAGDEDDSEDFASDEHSDSEDLTDDEVPGGQVAKDDEELAEERVVPDELVNNGLIDMPVLRKKLLEFMLEPIFLERSAQEIEAEPCGNFKCPKCQKHTHNQSKMDAVYATANAVIRHMRLYHTDWTDLEVDMLDNQDDSKYVCPTCEFSTDTVEAVRSHCLGTDCPDSDYYRSMKATHDTIKTKPTIPRPEPAFHVTPHTHAPFAVFLKQQEILKDNADTEIQVKSLSKVLEFMALHNGDIETSLLTPARVEDLELSESDLM